MNFMAVAAQPQGGTQAADARANDGDSQRFRMVRCDGMTGLIVGQEAIGSGYRLGGVTSVAVTPENFHGRRRHKETYIKVYARRTTVKVGGLE